MPRTVDKVLNSVRHLMLEQQVAAYESVKAQITGTSWKVVRYADIIEFCDERITELRRQMKAIK